MGLILPVIGVLIIGGMGLCFSVGIEGILTFIEIEKQRKEGENKVE